MLYSHTTPGAVVRKGATLASLMLALPGGAPAAAGQSSGTAAFVFLVGADTFGIERFTSSTQVLTGEVLLQGQPRISYLASRDGNGVGALRVIVYPPGSGPDAAALQSVSLRLVPTPPSRRSRPVVGAGRRGPSASRRSPTPSFF